MQIDLTKSPTIIQCLTDIVRHMSGLSQHDVEMHRLLHSLQQYNQHPQSVDSDHLKMTLRSLKDVGSAYSDHDKSLPNLFWHCITEIDFLADSTRLSAPMKHPAASILLNIERFRKHGIRQ